MTVTRLRTNYVLLLENTSFLLFRSHWSTWSTPNLNDQNHLSLTIYILAIHFFTRGITPSISASFSLTLSRQLHSTSPYQDPESLSLSSKCFLCPQRGSCLRLMIHFRIFASFLRAWRPVNLVGTSLLLFRPYALSSWSDLRFFSSGLPCQLQITSS